MFEREGRTEEGEKEGNRKKKNFPSEGIEKKDEEEKRKMKLLDALSD